MSGPKTNDPSVSRSKAEGSNQEPHSKPSKRKIAIIVAMLGLVAIAGTYFGTIYFSQSACPSGATLRSFVITANETTGYNSSRYQPFQMSVRKENCVLISFVNNSRQPHGLAISHYNDNGMIAQPKTTETARFRATETGQFSAYEQIYSSIYVWTRSSGTLNVA